MNNYYPQDTKAAIKLKSLIKGENNDEKKKLLLAERISTRMVKCASILDEGEHIGWQMYVPTITKTNNPRHRSNPSKSPI